MTLEELSKTKAGIKTKSPLEVLATTTPNSTPQKKTGFLSGFLSDIGGRIRGATDKVLGGIGNVVTEQLPIINRVGESIQQRSTEPLKKFVTKEIPENMQKQGEVLKVGLSPEATKEQRTEAISQSMNTALGFMAPEKKLSEIAKDSAKKLAGGLEKKVAQEAIPATKQNLQTITKESVKESSERIIKDTEKKATLDFTQQQVAKDYVAEKSGLVKKLKEALSPVKQLDKETQTTFKDWARGQLSAKEQANKYVGSLGDFSKEKYGLRTILDYEKAELGKGSALQTTLKSEFDKLHKEAQSLGIDVGYVENYLPQVYSNPRAEVMDSMARFMRDKGVDDALIKEYLSGAKNLPEEVISKLGLNPSFAKQRVMPNYETAIKYGLVPKYTNPEQLLAYYKEQLLKTVENRKFVESLMNSGKVLPDPIAPRGWVQIDAPFVERGYYAEPKTAKMLNNLFRDENNLGLGETLIKGLATASKKMQEVALSAGVPKTNINFFTIGQTIKAMTAGDFKAVVPLMRSNFTESSIKYFQKNQKYLQYMAEEGIDMGGRIGTYGKYYKNLVEKKKWTKVLNDGWDKLFNEKTFGSYMPQLYLQTFKDAMNKGMAKGMDDMTARKFAGDVTKKFFGLFENVGRGKGTEDALSAVFFAPKFREGIIRTITNTLKSVTTQIKNPAFYKNRRLVVGAIFTYGLYNALNYELNGNYMWENEPGKEFDLKIPTGDGQYAYIGFMPSFLALPRNMLSGTINLVKGNLDVATQKLGSAFSMPVKLMSEILSNEDYFGRAIYKDTDSGLEKIKKIAGYSFLSVNHPFVKEAYRQIFTDKPIYQSVSEAMELPIKFNSLEKIQKSQFYDAMDKQTQIRADANKKFKPTYDQINDLIDAGRKNEAQAIVDGLSEEDYALFKTMRSTDKRSATMAGEARMYSVYQQIKKLVKEGKREDAQTILDNLSEEDYRLYKLVKNKFE